MLHKLSSQSSMGGFATVALQRAFAEREGEIALQNADVPAAAVLNYRQLRRHPQVNARGMFREITHPAFGREVRAASLFERGQPVPPVDTAAPMFGQHNHEVLTRILGYEDDEVRALEPPVSWRVCLARRAAPSVTS